MKKQNDDKVVSRITITIHQDDSENQSDGKSQHKEAANELDEQMSPADRALTFLQLLAAICGNITALIKNGLLALLILWVLYVILTSMIGC
jgi:hypothetical protein